MHAFSKTVKTTSGIALSRYMPLWVLLILLLHVAAFYVLMHLKLPKINTQAKKPIQVRIIDLQPKAVVAPAQPKIPPKVEPKPITPEPPKPQPKVIATDKATPKPTTVVQKVDKPAPVTPPQPTPTVPTPVKPAPPSTNTEPPAPKTEAPVSQAPKRVQIGGNGAQWSRTPNPNYSNRDLAGQNRRIVVLISADEKGNISNVKLTQSSGLSNLDEKILRTVRNGKFKPYKENGVAISFTAEQPFDLTLNSND